MGRIGWFWVPSRLVRRLGIVIACAFLGGVTAQPAAAADDVLRDVTPGGAPVELTVRDTSAGVCLTVKAGDEAARRTSPCSPAPASAAADVTRVHVTYRARPEKISIVHGVLSPKTAVLQLRLGDNRLIELRPEGPARAYLAVFRGRPPVATARAVGPRGRDLAAADLDPRALKLEPRREATLHRTRDERGSRALLTAFTTPLLRPGSVRRSRAACVAVERISQIPDSNVEPGYAGGHACAFERGQIVVKYAAGCADNRVLLFGLAPVGVTRFDVVTANGRRTRLPTFRLPRRLRRSGRAFIFSRADPGALRRLEAYVGRRRVASLPLTSVGATCGASSRS